MESLRNRFWGRATISGAAQRFLTPAQRVAESAQLFLELRNGLRYPRNEHEETRNHFWKPHHDFW